MSKKRTNDHNASEKAEPTSALLPSGYSEFLVDLKNRVRSAQLKAAITVNTEMIQLYWDIGRAIVERQETAKWGSKVIDHIGEDLQKEFPGMSGFSRQNIYRMRAFFLAYSNQNEIVSQPASQLVAPSHALEIPWFHSVTIWEQVKDREARLWYAKATKEHGWSRAVLVHQIETDLYGRKGKAVSNFQKALPATTSDLARETLKDPFTFEFLTLADDHAEAELENGLLTHIRKFLLELGVALQLSLVKRSFRSFTC